MGDGLPEPLPPTVHATVLLVGAKGVLIRGRSGAGKSSLALALIEASRLRGTFAALVADDRVHLEARHGRLIARTPPALAGLIERRGFGIERMEHEPAAVLALVVDIEPDADLPRMPDTQAIAIEGVALPHLRIGSDLWAGRSLVLAALERGRALVCAGPA